MGGTEIRKEVRKFSILCMLLGRFAQGVWSRFIALCRGGALLCDKIVKKVAWQSPDQPKLLRRPCDYYSHMHVVNKYTCTNTSIQFSIFVHVLVHLYVRIYIYEMMLCGNAYWKLMMA